jgi:hypothetical protein
VYVVVEVFPLLTVTLLTVYDSAAAGSFLRIISTRSHFVGIFSFIVYEKLESASYSLPSTFTLIPVLVSHQLILKLRVSRVISSSLALDGLTVNLAIV